MKNHSNLLLNNSKDIVRLRSLAPKADSIDSEYGVGGVLGGEKDYFSDNIKPWGTHSLAAATKRKMRKCELFSYSYFVTL